MGQIEATIERWYWNSIITAFITTFVLLSMKLIEQDVVFLFTDPKTGEILAVNIQHMYDIVNYIWNIIGIPDYLIAITSAILMVLKTIFISRTYRN
jgi:hypothetical protein